MPKLWTNTIEAHRREVHSAILETAAALVAHQGILSVTMSQIAEEAGIGRATLYKYFPDVETILESWHQQQIEQHLGELAKARARPGSPYEQLAAVLERYALIQHELRSHHATQLAAHLHGGDHLAKAHRDLRMLVRSVLSEASRAGSIRADVSLDELVSFCLRALGAAADLPSKAAVHRLVAVTLDGLAVRPLTTAAGPA